MTNSCTLTIRQFSPFSRHVQKDWVHYSASQPVAKLQRLHQPKHRLWKKPERLNPTHRQARVQYTLLIFETISTQWPCPECALWDKPKSWFAVSNQHGVEGQPPLLTSPRAGKSLIFIQSPPAPLPAQGWTWESPVCPLLCANFRPHYSAVTNVRRGSHFHINTLRPEGKFPLQWIKGLHYCNALPLFPFLAPGVCCFFSPWAPASRCRPSSA